MAKVQKDDDYAKSRFRSFVIQRSYDYDVTVYDEETGEKHIPDDAPTPDEWMDKIIDQFKKEGAKADYYYFIFHDADYLPDGTLKSLHVHIVIHFKNPRTVGAVYKAFGVSRFENISKAKSIKGALKYLLHITPQAINDGKTVYGMDKLYFGGEDLKQEEYANNDDVYSHYKELINDNKNQEEAEEKRVQKQVIARCKSLLTDIATKGTAPGEWLETLWEDFEDYEDIVSDVYVNYKKKFQEMEKEYFYRLTQKKKREGRDLRNIFVSGEGNSLKSSVAKEIALRYADGRGYHIASPPSDGKTYDFVSLYKNEKVSILNEMVSDAFNPREFMNVFDDFQIGSVSSRFKDINWLADKTVMTTSDTFSEFRSNTFRYHAGGSQYYDKYGKFIGSKKEKDVFYQFSRRVEHYVRSDSLKEVAPNINEVYDDNPIKINNLEDKKVMSIYHFDKNKYGYVLQGIFVYSKENYKDEKDYQNLIDKICFFIDNPTFNISDDKVMVDDMLNQKSEDQMPKIKKSNYPQFLVDAIYNTDKLFKKHKPEFKAGEKVEIREDVLERIKKEEEREKEQQEHKLTINHIHQAYEDYRVDLYPVEALDLFEKRSLTDKERKSINQEELESFVVKKLPKNKEREDVYRLYFLLWEREFYDLKHGLIPCEGPTYDEVQQNITLKDKIVEHEEKVKEEELKRKERIRQSNAKDTLRRNVLKKHEAFNAKVGVTEKDKVEFLEQK